MDWIRGRAAPGAFVLLTLVVASTGGACARSAPQPPPATHPLAAKVKAPAPSAAASSAPPPAAPLASDVKTAHWGDTVVEVACNGDDDDGDGMVDFLLPVSANACSTGKRGACADGFAACEAGKRVCLGPSPTPEVRDGIDNDCNGVVDDVAPRSVHPRALLLAPKYAWSDAGTDIATVTSVLAQAGIPFDEQAADTEWTASLDALDEYTLAVVPGYMLGAAMGGAREKLEAFANAGGIVVFFKPVSTDEEPQAWNLAGIRSSARRRDVLEVRFDGAAAPITSDIDSPEERTLVVNAHAAPDAVEVYAMDPLPGTDAIAHAFVAGQSVGAAITRRPMGRGAIYALGTDLATFGAPRCYVNCFEPSGDVLRLVLEGAYREGASGHVVLKHTAPGDAASTLILTHDIDAPDSQNAGEWGEPGALQAAKIEKAHGIRATFNITTDYVSGYYNPDTIKNLCTLGMCPLGAHSVVHSLQFDTLPDGTCFETRASYGTAPTVCGEIHVSIDLVKGLTGTAPRVWRSPYLMVPPHLFDLLARNGIRYDSSYGVGDLPYNVPIDLSAVGFHQNWFHKAPILELPVACEDGLDVVTDGKHHRVDIQESNRAMFLTRWDYVTLRNAQNRGMTMFLMHPSRGREAPADNLQQKMSALEHFVGQALAADVVVKSFEEVGDFWRARLESSVDATYDPHTGYAGTLTIGKDTSPALTLEFGDAIGAFNCSACGEVHVKDKRVVLVNAPKPGTKLEFTATLVPSRER